MTSGRDWRLRPWTRKLGLQVDSTDSNHTFLSLLRIPCPELATRSREIFTGSFACLTLAFPTELNKPSWANEYLELVAFNIDSRGVGSLIGKADVEREGKEITWVYRYGTESIGSTWSGPEKLQEIPELTGNFEAFKNADLKKFVDDLTRNAVR